ncbi:ribosome small subunit-dependent GTPase A [Leifsonia xyli]|uniref:ribosome small subunit-dependent GTPase A n=1 Tax=Leifsonia xyli TaxID=1575 RepID=UPI003D67EE73
MPIGLNSAAARHIEAAERPPGAWLGRVSRVDRTVIRVLDQEAGERVHPRPREISLLVGDWVWISSHPRSGDSVHLVPRYSVLTRSRASGESHRLAANIDLALLVITAGEACRPSLIERLALTGWECGALPHFVVTKIDKADATTRSTVMSVISECAPGINATRCSSVTGEGIEEVRGIVQEYSSTVLLGHSGVGKSSLANRLLGRDALVTAGVRERDGKGRHTTTARTITPLPGSSSVILDTPGIREFGLSLHAVLEDVFVEIEDYAARCAFADCSHTHDSGCAVRDAVDSLAISEERYLRFLKLARQRQYEQRRLGPSTRDKSTEYARLARKYRQARGR